MVDIKNVVQATVDKQVIDAMVEHLYVDQQTLNFLISLTSDQHRSFAHPGTKGLDACAQMAEVAKKYPGVFPPNAADPEEILRDIELADRLRPLLNRLSAFHDAVRDTVRAAENDAFRGALELYAIAKVMNKSNAGIGADIDPLQAFLDRPSRRSTPAE